MLHELTEYIERYAQIPLKICISLIRGFWPYLIVIIKESSEKVGGYKSGNKREGHEREKREKVKCRAARYR